MFIFLALFFYSVGTFIDYSYFERYTYTIINIRLYNPITVWQIDFLKQYNKLPPIRFFSIDVLYIDIPFPITKKIIKIDISK